MSLKTTILNFSVATCAFLFGACTGNSDYQVFGNSVSIPTEKGQLVVSVLMEDAIRVQCIPEDIELPQLEELTYSEQPVPNCTISVTKKGKTIKVLPNRGNLAASINSRTGRVTFTDRKGNIILNEAKDSRSIVPGKTGDLNSLEVSQSFITAPNEFIFGK